MPIELITGPAVSGKTGEVLDRFADWLADEPILVVPRAADTSFYEEQLLGRAIVPFGARVVTFDALFRLIVESAGVVHPPLLGRELRTALLAAVVAETTLDLLESPARGRGFTEAFEGFVRALGAARITAADARERLVGAGRGRRARQLDELTRLYEGYERRRDGLGRCDDAGLAEIAIAAVGGGDAFEGTPILVHGFDDLNGQQLALIEAHARHSPVVVSAVHEPGRVCLEARLALVDAITALGDSDIEVRQITLPARSAGGALLHLERSFMEDDAPRLDPGTEIVCLEAAGPRAEVELVAANVASLLRAGEEPQQVGVIARTPDALAPLVGDVFAAYGIPHSIDARISFARCAIGGAIVALARVALGLGTGADLIRYLRYPKRMASATVDRIERSARIDSLTDVDEVLAQVEASSGRDVWELTDLSHARTAGIAPFLEELARATRNAVEYPYDRAAPVFDDLERGDAAIGERAADQIQALAEIALLDPSLVADDETLVRMLEDMTVRSGPRGAAGRVELLDPYAARARQFAHVFVISLQEGDFPGNLGDDPFLSDAERTSVGLPPLSDPKAEDRYLFYVAVSRATRRLHLSYRPSDETGREAVRSFFVDDVLALFDPPEVRSRGLSETVFAPSSAPTERELARALAVGRVTAPPAALRASDRLAADLAPRLASALVRADARPMSLAVPAVLAEFGERSAFGASSLENYVSCPFRYFVQHELKPERLVPKADALTRGSLVHAVLERVYSTHHVGSCPSPETLAAAEAEARSVLAELAPAAGIDASTPEGCAVLRRIESNILRYLRRDAERPLGEQVLEVEAGFGDNDDDHPPLELGGIKIHGQIDRIDLLPGGSALIHDYKHSTRVSGKTDLEKDGKLQLQLYLLAARELWGLDAAGGLYWPLAHQDPSEKPRGILRGPKDGAPIVDTAALKRTDFTDDADDFEEVLNAARDKAVEVGTDIRAGHLARRPHDGTCPPYCDFHPICRRERGEKNPEENTDGSERGEPDE